MFKCLWLSHCTELRKIDAGIEQDLQKKTKNTREKLEKSNKLEGINNNRKINLSELCFCAGKNVKLN